MRDPSASRGSFASTCWYSASRPRPSAPSGRYSPPVALAIACRVLRRDASGRTRPTRRGTKCPAPPPSGISSPAGVPTPTVSMRSPSSAAALRRGEAVPLEILAVGEEHQHLLVRGLVARAPRAPRRSRADVGAAARDRPGVERVERLEEHVVVERHRALHERVAGEGDAARRGPRGTSSTRSGSRAWRARAARASRRGVTCSCEVSTRTGDRSRAAAPLPAEPVCGRASATQAQRDRGARARLLQQPPRSRERRGSAASAASRRRRARAPRGDRAAAEDEEQGSTGASRRATRGSANRMRSICMKAVRGCGGSASRPRPSSAARSRQPGNSEPGEPLLVVGEALEGARWSSRADRWRRRCRRSDVGVGGAIELRRRWCRRCCLQRVLVDVDLASSRAASRPCRR